MKKVIIASILLTISCSSYAVRCADFSTQKEAQEYMEKFGATKLDGDRDGEACECLPGGSAYGSSVCRR